MCLDAYNAGEQTAKDGTMVNSSLDSAAEAQAYLDAQSGEKDFTQKPFGWVVVIGSMITSVILGLCCLGFCCAKRVVFLVIWIFRSCIMMISIANIISTLRCI